MFWLRIYELFVYRMPLADRRVYGIPWNWHYSQLWADLGWEANVSIWKSNRYSLPQSHLSSLNPLHFHALIHDQKKEEHVTVKIEETISLVSLLITSVLYLNFNFP